MKTTIILTITAFIVSVVLLLSHLYMQNFIMAIIFFVIALIMAYILERLTKDK